MKKSLRGLNQKQRRLFLAFIRSRGLNLTRLASTLFLKGVLKDSGLPYTYESLRTMVSRWTRGEDRLTWSVANGVGDILGKPIIEIIKPSCRDLDNELIEVIRGLDSEVFSNLLLMRSIESDPLDTQRGVLFALVRGLPSDEVKSAIRYFQYGRRV